MPPKSVTPLPGVEIRAPRAEGADELLSIAAIGFLADLARRFGPRVEEALARRAARRERLAAGERLDFLPETKSIREGAWRIAPTPPDLQRRIVEITGPVDPKMVINALNSGADCYRADFEDSTTPTWASLVEGQRALHAAVRRTLAFTDPATGKAYRLGESPAVLLVRPRGLHLPEGHVHVDGRPMPGPLFDFGLFFFHNARELLARGTGPYFYLPKLESHLEARLWNDVFIAAQESLGVPRGSIKATVLIETLFAAFEMDEILHELREHAAGLNCGRWDYIFSFIKARRHDPSTLLPDRSQVTMEQPCMRAYTTLSIRTCHRRGAHAMGGMAAQIPIRNDPAASERALEKVRADKRREVGDGHDGTWVAHPGLVPVAREVFEAALGGRPNQLDRLREDVTASAAALLEVPTGTRTEAGLRHDVRVGIQYLEAWVRGIGCVPLYHLMEDAATAEISRAQVWHWIRHGATLDDGRRVTAELFRAIVDEEMGTIAGEVGITRYETGRYSQARDLFVRLSTSERLEEFLTLPAYQIVTTELEEEQA
ncbi:MAG TPA: malate synthase A [Candidatus Eisenbacteria bacterium]|nr:malate synthase A [Candidatus Eisenbacteria bacterium]